MPETIRIAVIMAGGTGERFWPLSRTARPKQLLCLTRPDLSLLEEAIERISPLIPPERILIATSATVAAPIRAALASSVLGVPAENIIVEPAKRNTAGALAFAAAHAAARWPDRSVSMAVLTADHCIGLPDRFRATVAGALDAAERERALVTIGVVPDRPETGYGYIEIAAGAAAAAGDIQVLPVASFREKPDCATAEQFVASGRFLWNSGMFFWTIEAFLGELERAAPAHATASREMAEAIAAGDEAATAKIFEGLEDVSIDYALMERAGRVLVARAEFPWDDVGAWDALARSFPADAMGNVALGEPILIDTRDTIVYNEPGAGEMAVAVLGVEGLVVVVSKDGVLVAPRERAQEVKKIVGELKRRGGGQI